PLLDRAAAVRRHEVGRRDRTQLEVVLAAGERRPVGFAEQLIGLGSERDVVQAEVGRAGGDGRREGSHRQKTQGLWAQSNWAQAHWPKSLHRRAFATPDHRGAFNRVTLYKNWAAILRQPMTLINRSFFGQAGPIGQP